MAASIWNPGSTTQEATGNGTVSETVPTILGQTLIPITLFTYTQGAKALFVYLNGVLQILNVDYTETSETSITLTAPTTDINDVVTVVGIINLVNVATNTYDSVELDIAVNTTTDIGAPRSSFIRVVGAGTINSFGINFRGPIFVRFSAGCTLVSGSALILPGGVNLVVTSTTYLIVTPKATLGVADGWIVTVR